MQERTGRAARNEKDVGGITFHSCSGARASERASAGGWTDGRRAGAALIIARLGSRRFIQLNANAGRRLRGRRGG